MAKPSYLELGDGTRISILYEDRSVLAIDKPAGWMLVPYSWQRTQLNLQAAIVSSIASGEFWARSRNLRFLRYAHRLDADTSGVLLFARSPGALDTFRVLFQSRRMEKIYLAVVQGTPREAAWDSTEKIGPDPREIGRMQIDAREGKESETRFRVLQVGTGCALVEARPITGRTHQIRLHLAACGHPVVGDPIYGGAGQKQAGERRAPRVSARPGLGLGLRAISLGYEDPFTGRPVLIKAPPAQFLRQFGFEPSQAKG